jgi:hypothetical protein
MKTCKHPTCSGECRRPPKPKPSRKRIARFSLKRQKINRSYSKESKQFLTENPICVIQSPDCTGKAQGVNHKKGRIGKNLMDKSTWEPSCNPCNVYIEDHPLWGIENGHKVSRLK